MSEYDVKEASVDDGEPYFLYLFDDGITENRFTSDPVNLTKMAETWLKSPVSHGDLEQTGSIEKAAVDLEFSNTDTFARTFLAPASAITTVTIWRGHHTDLTETHRVVWKGRVVGAKASGQKIVISVESVFTSLRRPGCRSRMQSTCRFSVYHNGCNLDRADFEEAGTVSDVSGLVLTITEAASAPANDYKAGMVGYNGAFGWIENHTGDQITLTLPIPGLAEAVAIGPTAVTLYPGCNLTIERCNDRFDNKLNNGSFPYIPHKNPFGTSLV